MICSHFSKEFGTLALEQFPCYFLIVGARQTEATPDAGQHTIPEHKLLCQITIITDKMFRIIL